MKKILAMGALLFVGLFPGSAAGDFGTPVVPGDVVAIRGTKVVCDIVGDDTLRGLQCSKRNTRGPVVGTLGISIDQNDNVQMLRMGPGQTAKPIVRRRPAAVGKKRLVLGENQMFFVLEAQIFCNVFNLRTGPALTRGMQVECLIKRDPMGGFPKTWAAGISDRYASVFYFNGQRARMKADVRPQPR
jgi:hypothetical protein